MLINPGHRKVPGTDGAVDLVVLGSGPAGLAAALTGLLEGLSVVVLEIAGAFGGTAARSSGTAWLPGNRLMHEAGFAPDRQAAENYLDALIGERGPRAPWQAFLDAAPLMQADLEDRANIAFRPYLTAPDYSGDLPGAGTGGRSLEPLPFDGRLLGPWFSLLAWPMPELMVFGGMMVTRGEAQQLINAERSLTSMMLGAKMVSRFALDRLRHKRGTRLVIGNALIARLMYEVLSRGGMLYENADTSKLTVKNGRITGVQGRWRGLPYSIEARRGVVLAGGGFPADPAKRQANLPSPTPRYTPAVETARGTTIDLGLAAGAVMGPSGHDNALWFPSSIWNRPDGGQAVYPHIVLDRAKPGSIAVDANGKRFVNEAISYHDFCRGMYAHGEAAIPCWMIADRDFIRRYGLGVIRPRTPSLKGFIASGYLKHGRDIAALAAQIGVPADALAATVQRFNTMAKAGRDDDFKRGETAYQRANGDASRGLQNPCIAPLGERDLYAVAMWPTPLGTSRGLMASVNGEVLDAQGAPITGLYVAGNDMQSCFAGEYPGGGAQIGQGMTFGWLAARHAASTDVNQRNGNNG